MENLTVVARKERLSKLSAIRLERFHLRYASYRPKGSLKKTSEVGVSSLSRPLGNRHLTFSLSRNRLRTLIGTLGGLCEVGRIVRNHEASDSTYKVESRTVRARKSKFYHLKAYLDGTDSTVSNREGTIEIFAREMKIQDNESPGYIYEHMRSNCDPTLYRPESSVKNLLKMVAYVDKRASSVRPNKICAFSVLEELGQKRPPLSQK